MSTNGSAHMVMWRTVRGHEVKDRRISRETLRRIVAERGSDDLPDVLQKRLYAIMKTGVYVRGEVATKKNVS